MDKAEIKPEWLEITFHSGDLGRDLTIRAFMKELLKALWEEGEGFSGKRPLGNSGWEYDIIAALIKEGALTGSLDSEGYADDYDRDQFDAVIQALIEAM